MATGLSPPEKALLSLWYMVGQCRALFRTTVIQQQTEFILCHSRRNEWFANRFIKEFADLVK